MISVVVVPTDNASDFVGAQMLPPTKRIARGADRIYHFYSCDLQAECSFRDLDGQMLIEVHVFADVEGADTWVSEDIKQRHVVIAADGAVQ